jgi:hypothetical protein
MGGDIRMPLLRRTPLVRTTVDLYEAGRVSVEIIPGQGRWPGKEGSDRLVIPLGLAALALARSQAGTLEIIRGRLRAAASAAVDGDPRARDERDWCRDVTGLELIAAGAPGQTRISAQLVKSALGPVPTIGRATPGTLSLGVAAAAALAVCSYPIDAGGRLATALALEGLLGWYREADPHLQPPQQAVAYSLRHAVARLAEAGRASPPELMMAVAEHRKISPMAGGAA